MNNAFDIFSSIFEASRLGKQMSAPKNSDSGVLIKDGDTNVEYFSDGTKQVNSVPNYTNWNVKFDLGNHFPSNTRDSGSSIKFPPNFYSWDYSNVSTGTGYGQEIFPRYMVKSSAEKQDKPIEFYQRPGSSTINSTTDVPLRTPTQSEALGKAVLHYSEYANPLYYTGFGSRHGAFPGALAGAASFAVPGALLGYLAHLWNTRDYPEELKDADGSMWDSVKTYGTIAALLGAGTGALLGSDVSGNKSKTDWLKTQETAT